LLGPGFLLIAALKPVFPNNVGFWVHDGPGGDIPFRLAADFPAPPNQHVVGGYWVIVVGLFFGFGLLVLTHRLARRFLAGWRSRRVS
jgi:hypothetical protein